MKSFSRNEGYVDLKLTNPFTSLSNASLIFNNTLKELVLQVHEKTVTKPPHRVSANGLVITDIKRRSAGSDPGTIEFDPEETLGV